MKQPSKEDTLKKWAPILDSMGIITSIPNGPNNFSQHITSSNFSGLF